jgi:hypothetical protein
MDRSAGGSSAKLEKISELLLIESVHNLPKPLNYFVTFIVFSLVFGIQFPILDVNVRNSINEHFDFKRLKDSYQLFRYNFIKPFSDAIY